MKSKIKIFNVILLTAIYCFAIDAFNISFSHSDFNNPPSSSQEKIFSNVSAKLFCNTSQSESLVQSGNNLPAPNLNNEFTSLCLITKATEQLIATRFSQYTTFSRNILINYRKSDIIFPFHYFW